MLLLDLPNEILLLIAENLQVEGHINAFARTNDRLYSILNPYLYRHNVEREDGTALTWAAKRGQDATAQKSLEAAKIGVATQYRYYGRADLLWAVRNGHESVVRLLIGSGLSSLNPEDFSHELLCAARFGQTTVVQLLLESVDVNCKWENGRTPLSLAAEKGHENMVQLLLECENVHVDARDRIGRTPLSWAVDYKHNTVVQLLVKHGGVNINSKDSLGRTPLSIAKARRDATIVQLLLECESDSPKSMD